MTTRSGPIRVLVAADHSVLRRGIAVMLGDDPDIELAGEAENGQQAIEAFASLRPDVTLLDLQMPVMGGIDAITEIGIAGPTRVLSSSQRFRATSRLCEPSRPGRWVIC